MTEAMAVGLPVVAYKSCSGVNEIIVDAKNGFLAEDGIEDFASKLEKLMKNKELRMKMGNEARKTVLDFRPNKVWDKWENVVCNLLK